jgi:hypothetical protein
MLFRLRSYETAPERVADLTDHFRERLLPIQRRHGARLVGRWQTGDGARVLTLWAYRDAEHYAEVRAAVDADPDLARAMAWQREHLGELYTRLEDVLLTSTIALEETELAHLVADDSRAVG